MGGQQRLESSRELGAEASWGQQQFGGSSDVGAAGARHPQRLGGGQQQRWDCRGDSSTSVAETLKSNLYSNPSDTPSSGLGHSEESKNHFFSADQTAPKSPIIEG